MSKFVILCTLATAFVSTVLSQSQTASNCPTISITGPAGIIRPGDTATFTASVEDPQRFGPLQNKWTFSGGEILTGQDTAEITVRAKKTEPVQMYATVRVSGLPQGCLDTASEKVEFFGEPHPILIDEFGTRPKANIEARLRKFFAVLQNNRNNQGYIIVYGTKKEITSRERLIVSTISFRNFDRSRITIVRGRTHDGGRVYTKLYRIPPGADNPAP